MLPPILHKLKRAVAVLAVAALFFLSITVGYAATEKHFSCGDHKVFLSNVFPAGYAFVATMHSRQMPHVMQLFINLNTGAWLIVGVADNNQSCVLLEGEYWQNAIIREG